MPITYAGATLSICTTPQNAAIGDASPGWSGLTFVEIANVGNIGEYGYNTNMVQYPTLADVLVLKAKGLTDGGNMTFEVSVNEADPGQIACDEAGVPGLQDNYAFRVQFSDNSVHYLRGPVGGPNYPGGGNEDFKRAVYTLAVNEIYKVPA